MIIKYRFEQYDYICVHQNSILNRLQNEIPNPEYTHAKIPMIGPCTISSPSIQEIVYELKICHEKQSLLLFDLRNMTYGPVHEMDLVFDLLSHNLYNGICFLQDDAEINNLLTIKCKKMKEKNTAIIAETIENNGLYCGDDKTFDELIKHLNTKTVSSVIDDDINRYIFGLIKTDESAGTMASDTSNESDTLTPNYSSNVYINRYFDAKKILTNSALFYLVIYRIAIMLDDAIHMTKKDEFDAFVCASLTGACLASGLAAIFHKPVIYLKNFGPRITANDGRMIARIRKDKRYVFVYDFMCLGKEYERIQMICNLQSAFISCCVGISYYRFPRFEKAEVKINKSKVRFAFDWNSTLKIASLFQVNSFEQNYYYCVVQNTGKEVTRLC